MAKSFGGITAIKGTGVTGFVRGTIGPNMAEAGRMMRAGWRSGRLGGMYEAAAGYMGYRGIGRFGRTGIRDVMGAGSVMRANVFGQKLTTMGSQATARFNALSLGRRAGVFGAPVALGLGVSALTGYSMFDQAQAVGGGYIGAKAAGRAGLWGGGFRGKALGVGMAAAAGLGGQALGAQEWMLGAAGYGAVRGAQALAAPKMVGAAGRMGARAILPRGRFGGAWGRAAGAAVGVGLGLII